MTDLPMSSSRRQRGQMAIGAAIAVAILAVALAAWVTFHQRQQRNDLANIYGHSLSQYAVGLRGYIAAVQGGTVTLPGNPHTFTGVNWLKSPTCGGLAGNPQEGFVPCTFQGQAITSSASGLRYHTKITRTPATDRIEARAYFFVPKGSLKPAARATFASKVEFAALAQQDLINTGTFYQVFANSPITANNSPDPSAITAGNRGRVMAVVSNAPANDVYLRVDGSNKMLADLNMGGNSLDDAENGTFNKDLRVKGIAQIDKGLTVTNGPADFRDGVTANDVKITSINRMVSQALYNMEVLTGSTSYKINKPNCSNANLGTSQASIYAALQSTGSAADVKIGGKPSDALYDARVVVENHGGANSGYWTVRPEIRTTQFSLKGSQSGDQITLTLNKKVSSLAAAKDQTILVMTKCR